MNRLTEAADRYLRDCTWKDISILKFCLIALGVLLGIAVPARRKKASAGAAALVFAAPYVPLLGTGRPSRRGARGPEGSRRVCACCSAAGTTCPWAAAA